MSWEDILKVPYNMEEYDAQIDNQVEEKLDEILGVEFDNAAKLAQQSDSGPWFRVVMQEEDYTKCLGVVRNDIDALKQAFIELYAVSDVSFQSGDNKGSISVVFER